MPLKYKLEDIITLSIVWDGVAFIAAFPYFFVKYQDKYPYYRSLIYKYIFKNQGHLKHLFPKEDNEIDNEYNNGYLLFIQNKR